MDSDSLKVKEVAISFVIRVLTHHPDYADLDDEAAFEKLYRHASALKGMTVNDAPRMARLWAELGPQMSRSDKADVLVTLWIIALVIADDESFVHYWPGTYSVDLFKYDLRHFLLRAKNVG